MSLKITEAKIELAKVVVDLIEAKQVSPLEVVKLLEEEVLTLKELTKTEIATDQSFRGFIVKPGDRGLSLLTSNDDVVFNGRTDRFKFTVVAKDLTEANNFAKNALGHIDFAWE